MPLLTVLPAGVTFPVHPGENILAAVHRAGHTYHFGCRRGGCAECKAWIVEGQITYERRVATSVLNDDERNRSVCLTCRAVPVDDVVIRLRDDDCLTCKSHLAWSIAERELKRLTDLPTN
jgi:ferredoxin